jgi:hypothetical protein
MMSKSLFTKQEIAELNRARGRRKARQTQLGNQAWQKRWREVEEPAQRRMDELLGYLLENAIVGIGLDVRLHWNPAKDVGRKLKQGAEYGTLLEIKNGGRILRVRPDGYKTAFDYHPAFWELAR